MEPRIDSYFHDYLWYLTSIHAYLYTTDTSIPYIYIIIHPLHQHTSFAWCMVMHDINALNLLMNHVFPDSLYLRLIFIHNLWRSFKCVCHPLACVWHSCDLSCLCLSWLVCYSDEEGNIRRMIYVYDISFVCPTACSYMYSNSADSFAQQTAQAHSTKGNLRLHWGMTSYPSIMLLNNTIYHSLFHGQRPRLRNQGEKWQTSPAKIR